MAFCVTFEADITKFRHIIPFLTECISGSSPRNCKVFLTDVKYRFSGKRRIRGNGLELVF